MKRKYKELAMKKISILAFLSFCVVILPQAGTVSKANVKSLQGNVQILEKEGAAPKDASQGMELPPSSHVITGAKSYCVVQLNEKNSFRIKQNAEVVIAKIWEEAKKINGTVVSEVQLNLLRGELTAKLDELPKGSEFNVVGPVAIAGAAGTVYTVSVESETQKTSVTVLDHAVHVQSMNEPDKFIEIQKFQSVSASPWANTHIEALGRGVLSEEILGKKFVQAAESDIKIEGWGNGHSAEDAKLKAIHQLSKTVLQLRVDQETTLESQMMQDQGLTRKVYQTLSGAKEVGSIQNPDGTFQVKVQIGLLEVNQALGKSLQGMTQSVIPITLSEYSSKFGALARVTTQRAAQVEGYRNLAEMIYGTVVSSETTVEDFAVKDDTVRTVVQGFVKGAVVRQTQYFSDGSIVLLIEMRGDIIPEQLGPVTGNVFGQNYLSGPQLIEFENFDEMMELENASAH
jgi:hypothetical protein